MYEIRGNNSYLIHWNKNHETVTGYSAKEIKDKNVFDFFYPSDFSIIEKGLSEIMHTGHVKQVFANLKLKDGSTLPYLFEGYQFYSGEKICFMGVGIDMSMYIASQEELALAKEERDTYAIELKKKERELLSFLLEKSKQVTLQNYLLKQFKQLNKSQNLIELKNELSKLEKEINIHPKQKELWEVFKYRFNDVHTKFFKHLKKMHPNLTRGELRVCAYIKMKMSTDHISAILNISKDGVKKSRYRLRKKMELERNQSLEDYIDGF